MINENELDNLIQKLKKQKDEIEKEYCEMGFGMGLQEGKLNTLEEMITILESFKPKQ